MIKTVLTFLIGAVLAAVVVFYATGSKTTPPPVVQQTTAPVQSAEPVASTALPKASPAAPSPIPATPSHASESRITKAKPSAMPKTGTVITAQNKPATSPTPGAVSTPIPANNGPSNPVPSAAPANNDNVVHLPVPPLEPPRMPERVPETVTIPAGTSMNVRIDQGLSTERNKSGDSFRASLDSPLVINGMVIAERGARVQGRIVESDIGGRVSGLAKMTLELTSLTTSDGQHVRLQTDSFARSAESGKKKDAAKVGAAAGIGAAIGAIAGGGKGAAIGAAIGGGAGAGGVMATRGASAEIPAETRMTFRLAQPLTITEKL